MPISSSPSEVILNWITTTHRLIEGKDTSLTQPPSAVTAQSKLTFNKLITYWNILSSREKKSVILSSIALLTTFYILSPTLFPSKKMFSKRPDKHTTGLINLRNDCFANSSLQAYLSLPGLTEYLNKFIGSYETIKSLLPNSKAELELEKDQAKQGVPLHIAMAKILKKLQETRLTSRTVSVWTFLHTLETIFHAKISRSQHDAHELTQLINETLENENLRVQTLLKKLLESENEEVNVVIKEQLSGLEVPEFPLSGLTLNHMVCLTCKHVSTPSFVPFLMLTLNTPEKVNSELETILDENESETIEGYQCLKCRISKIVANEEHLKRNDKSSGKDSEEILKLSTYNDNPQFCINEDLPKDLEEFVKSYNKGGLDISKVTSTVMRKHQILKPPKIFGIHLSRSSFDGVQITRNSCRVAFKDQLTLSIGKEYTNELQKFKENSFRGKKEGVNIKSNVLTTDVNDMEDEDVQREDIDENGEEADDDMTNSSATDSSDNQTDGNDETDEAAEEDDGDDSSSLTSTESAGAESVATSTTFKGGSTVSATPLIFSQQATSSRVPETLNNTPITEDQTDDLKTHFKSFKFNDNDVYKYRLKALIRHQGSHTQGHYECYKRKPLFVKDKDGTIYKLSPEIDDEIIENENGENHNRSDTSEAEVNVKPMSSEDHQNFINSNENGELKGTGSNQFRRRFSNIMGRRPSVVHTHHTDSNIQEIIHSGLQTPAELLVDNPEREDYFSSFKDPFPQDGKRGPPKEEKKVKMTKISSLIKNPYWRISDSQVVEVSRSAVLFETASVYMLYYERVDRKQIKR